MREFLETALMTAGYGAMAIVIGIIFLFILSIFKDDKEYNEWNNDKNK